EDIGLDGQQFESESDQHEYQPQDLGFGRCVHAGQKVGKSDHADTRDEGEQGPRQQEEHGDPLQHQRELLVHASSFWVAFCASMFPSDLRATNLEMLTELTKPRGESTSRVGMSVGSRWNAA